MTTLIAVHNSDGLVGRCDAHCYNAQHPHCTCVCGGKNHGVGFEAAWHNTKEIVEELEERLLGDGPKDWSEPEDWQVKSILDLGEEEEEEEVVVSESAR